MSERDHEQRQKHPNQDTQERYESEREYHSWSYSDLPVMRHKCEKECVHSFLCWLKGHQYVQDGSLPHARLQTVLSAEIRR